jgi:hypothetical protein
MKTLFAKTSKQPLYRVESVSARAGESRRFLGSQHSFSPSWSLDSFTCHSPPIPSPAVGETLVGAYGAGARRNLQAGPTKETASHNPNVTCPRTSVFSHPSLPLRGCINKLYTGLLAIIRAFMKQKTFYRHDARLSRLLHSVHEHPKRGCSRGSRYYGDSIIKKKKIFFFLRLFFF